MPTAPTDTRRRALLALVAGSPLLLTSCVSSRWQPLDLQFEVPGWGGVRVQGSAAGDYRLAPLRGGIETWIIDRVIHLVVHPSLALAGEGRILRVGQLVRPPLPAAPAPGLFLPAAVRAEETAERGERLRQRIEWHDPYGRKHQFETARWPALAALQFACAAGLAASMDMDLCGGAVRTLLALWPPPLCGHGHAILGSDSGLRLARTQDEPAPDLRLPEGLPLEDYRPA